MITHTPTAPGAQVHRGRRVAPRRFLSPAGLPPSHTPLVSLALSYLCPGVSFFDAFSEHLFLRS